MATNVDSQISHSDQIAYWSSQSADVSGMLGNYPQVSRVDLQGSKNFISKVQRLSKTTTTNTSGQEQKSKLASTSTTKQKVKRVVDCGAGIGRITSGLLLNVADTVDIVEPVTKFTDKLGDLVPSSGQGQVGQIFNVGLETWNPPSDRKYDIVWIQWCLGHLTDLQAVEFLKRASLALAGYDDDVEGEQSQQQGWILVKENLSTDQWHQDSFDEVDSSVTRSDRKFKQIFEDAGLDIVKAERQSGFPKSLYPVKMYALRPK